MKPGQTVLELTSGNTGTGLAIVCGIKGYPFVALMSKGNSPERAQMMTALGAEVILVDQLPGAKAGQESGCDLELVEQAAQRIEADRQAFRADQFRLVGNFRAHYLHTGPELLRQTDGAIDAFCDFVGTGGTFAGCAAALKEHNSSVRCFVVEPAGAPAIAGAPVTQPSHGIQGGGYSRADLPQVLREHIDGFLTVTDVAARQFEVPQHRSVELIRGEDWSRGLTLLDCRRART
ncbi:MAG: pyridoxal-phosphate dependent enzyme [Verrucomicrobiota bacterium]